MNERERAFQALALVNSEIFNAAAREVSERLTAIVMHPQTSPEDRERCLHEHHAITRLMAVIDNWAIEAHKEDNDIGT